jgi:hypothetical protein
MLAEEFYKKIQERVDQTNFESDWNKNEIWQRIEQKQTKRKKPFVWWQAVAASVLILGGLGFYFYNQKAETTTNNQAVNYLNLTNLAKPTLNSASKSIRLMANNENRKNNVVKVMSESNQQSAKQLTPNPSENNLTNNQPNEIQNDVSTNETEIANNQKTPTSDNYRFVPYQGFVEKRVAPQRRERIAILEIPDDEEDYNQAPQKEKKNGLVARLSRKIGKKGVEPTEELPSINNKPNKVWIFVKESLKHWPLTRRIDNRLSIITFGV